MKKNQSNFKILLMYKMFILYGWQIKLGQLVGSFYIPLIK